MTINTELLYILLLSTPLMTFLPWHRYRLRLARLIYAKKRRLSIDKSEHLLSQHSCLYDYSFTKITHRLPISEAVDWYEFSTTRLAAGNGSSTRYFDLLHIKGMDFLRYRHLQHELVESMQNRPDSYQQTLPANIIAFLNRYGLSLESGDFGCYLIKTCAPFSVKEISDSVKELSSLHHLLRKAP